MGSPELIIIGGGPAGISTALHVASSSPALAERTVVLEKERYPRDKFCAGAIGMRAITALSALGVRLTPDVVPRVPIDAFSFAAAGERWVVREPGIGWVVRRAELDHALANEAIARGIRIREGTAVLGVESGADGVRVKLANGDTLLARAVVGADGVGGPVRRTSGLPRGHLRAQAVELDTEILPDDPPRDALHFDFEASTLRGYAWDFPTLVDGVPKVCRGVYRVVPGPGDRDDARERLARFVADKGLDIASYRVKQLAERGFDPREPISRPRVLLVGESAGIDLATGEGIAQAIQYGALAGAYLARAFRAGDLSFGDWLATVHADGLGHQLRARLWAYGRFFGDDRRAMERVIRRSSGALRVGMRNWAGKPNDKVAWVRALADLGPALLEHGPSLVLRTLRSLRARR